AIQEVVDGDRDVYIVGATGQTYKRLTKLGLLKIVPAENFLPSRVEALRQAVIAVNRLPKTENLTSGSSDSPIPAT
ncbi:MAG: sodium-independent anion transporter, partial [Cyanobacteria bacterium J06553_1]